MKGKVGSSDTPQRAKWAARSRAYYAKHKAELSVKSNAWNRTHKEEGRKRSKAWSKNNSERARQLRNDWTAANRERSREIQKAWHAEHPGYNAQKSMECYVRQQEKLAGRKKPKRCDVYRKPGKICFDHCHKSGRFRGWLCSHCNLILGFVFDKPKTLQALVYYLASPNPVAVKILGRLNPKLRRELGSPPIRCAACKMPGKRICADHCHKTKLFRGWLCDNCNGALGHAHDSIELLVKLTEYPEADKVRQKEKKLGKKK